MRLPTRFAVLGERDYRLFFIGNVVSLMGDFMLPVALSFAILDKYDDPGAVGVVLTAYTTPMVLLLLVGGVVADRLPRRAVLIASDGVSCVAQAVAAVLLATGNWELWHLAALEAVRGAAHAFAVPTYAGLLPEIASAPRLQEANALRSIGWSAAQIAGPAVAGVLYAFGGGGLAIGVNAATYAVSVGCLAAIRPRSLAARERSSMLADLREGWQEFRSRTWLWVIVAQFSVFHLVALPAVYVLGALVSKTDYGGPSAWATALSASGIGAVLGGFAALHLHVRRPLLVGTFCVFGWALLSAALALRVPVAILAAVSAIGGAGFAIFGTLWETTLQREVPPERLSRVSAYDWFGSTALLPIGYALVGPLAGGLGVTPTLWLAFASVVVPTLLVLCVPSVTGLVHEVERGLDDGARVDAVQGVQVADGAGLPEPGDAQA